MVNILKKKNNGADNKKVLQKCNTFLMM